MEKRGIDEHLPHNGVNWDYGGVGRAAPQAGLFEPQLRHKVGRNWNVQDAVGLPWMAEGVGFEPTSPFGKPVFKTGAIVRSATPPVSILLKSRAHCQPALDAFSRSRAMLQLPS